MITDNQSGLNRLHVVLDALVTVVSYLLAWYIVIGSGWARQRGKRTPVSYTHLDVYKRQGDPQALQRRRKLPVRRQE